MGEIDGPKLGVNHLNFTGIQKNSEPVVGDTAEQNPQITDFADDKAEMIGRSVLFKGNDHVNNDLKAIMDNPQIADNSDALFETTYAAALAAGMPNPYEEAASASTVSC